ncbi:MAG: hypothetical protein AB7H80_02175 [Candidatus Kapaibacterium sp.]
MEETLTYIGFAIFFFPLIVGLIRFRQLSSGQRLLVYFICFVIVNSVAAEIVGQVYGNNLILYHLFTFVEFFVLVYLFRRSMRRIPTIVFAVPAIIFTVVGVWSVVTEPFELPDLSRIVESVILISFSLLFFYSALRYLEVQKIERTFNFWISGGVLLDFTGNLLLDAFGNYIAQTSDHVYYTVWTIHTIFNMILYPLYGVALLCKDPTPPSSQSSS